MTPILLHHGTTLHRARLIAAGGPDPNYREPYGPLAEFFSTAYADPALVPRLMGHPEDYARMKAANFPNEGGPVILELEVPTWIVDVVLADSIGGGLAQGGEVRFDPGFGLGELLREWLRIPKRIVTL